MNPVNFDFHNCYSSVRLPVFARNAVATSHPLAAQAGLRMLWKGGNAVDAAIACAAAMTIVEPVSNGLGSDAFCILWDGKELHGLNSSGPAPAAWTVDYFRRRYGTDAKSPPKRGFDSVTVPGAVASWVALSERFGKLPFADLLEPAIEIAERGYLLPVVVRQKWSDATPELGSLPGFAQSFLPWGRPPRVGELFQFKAAARALRAIGETKGAAFYGGEIAQAVEKFAAANGGSIIARDFAAFEPEWVKPIGKEYRGYTLHEIPPNGQGIAALMALGILKNFDVAGLPVDGADSQHLQIEAMKLAFADVYRYVSEPRTMEVTPQQMLDDGYLASRAKLIDMKRAQDFGAGNPVKGGTIYLTAADENGMMVSFIQSNYMGFGSGCVEPAFGISLQNRGHGFSLQEGPNQVAPGKRPFHTIIPAFLSRPQATSHPLPLGEGRGEGDLSRPQARSHPLPPGEGRGEGDLSRPQATSHPLPPGEGRGEGDLTVTGIEPVLSFGVMGGNMQPQGHMQTLVRMLDYGQNPQAACDAPRWRFNKGVEINAERQLDADTVRTLKERGHRIEVLEDSYQDFGAGQFIWRAGEPKVEGYLCASDPRRDGLVAGF